jgi:hypothetical protein
LEGLTKPTFFTEIILVSTTTEINLFLPFLAALNKDLAGDSSKEPEVNTGIRT